MATKPICSIPGCGKASRTRGWCVAHYSRFLRHGGPLEGDATPGFAAEYFRGTVLTYRGESCLLWPHSRDGGTGYAVMSRNGKRWLVYRAAAIIIHGRPEFPKLEAAHTCGNGHLGCVNPMHIKWKTHLDNHSDRVAHGTANRGEKSGKSKLKEADVRKIRAMPGVPNKVLAEMFGVSRPTISEIKNRKKWAWLD